MSIPCGYVTNGLVLVSSGTSRDASHQENGGPEQGCRERMNELCGVLDDSARYATLL